MPNRIIRESCRTSPTLDRLSDGAERMFWRLTTVADDFGRFEADPRVILASCFPLKVNSIKLTKIVTWLNECVESGLIKTYSSNDKTFGFFNTWDKHQTKRAKHSKYPSPTPDNICEHMKANVSEESRNREARNRGIEKRGIVSNEIHPLFDSFWKAYPKKQGKGKCEDWFTENNPDQSLLDKMLKKIGEGKASDQWRKNNGEFVPMPITWLNQKRWDDDFKVDVDTHEKITLDPEWDK